MLQSVKVMGIAKKDYRKKGGGGKLIPPPPPPQSY